MHIVNNANGYYKCDICKEYKPFNSLGMRIGGGKQTWAVCTSGPCYDTQERLRQYERNKEIEKQNKEKKEQYVKMLKITYDFLSSRLNDDLATKIMKENLGYTFKTKYTLGIVV